MVIDTQARNAQSPPEPADPYRGTNQVAPEPHANAQGRIAAHSDDAYGCDLPETDDWLAW